MAYEFILLPSVYLVYVSSPNKRAIIISYYFLFWTQLGSFLVFCGILFIHNKTGYLYFTQYYTQININLFWPILLIFVGFIIKIPIWPFHFWLTKTHVEANTSFSIFLSGVLVKTALFGLYKFGCVYYLKESNIVLFLIIYSFIDASLKLWEQVDLKKLIAYLTVQEMGLITLALFFINQTNYRLLVIFTIFHTTVSAIFFFVNDSLYKRYNSRQLNQVSGIINNFPWLGSSIIIISLFFIGFPLTIKFYIELLLMGRFFFINTYLLFLFIFFIQYITVIIFFKNIVYMLFGYLKIFTQNDMNIFECVIYLYTLLILIIISIC